MSPTRTVSVDDLRRHAQQVLRYAERQHDPERRSALLADASTIDQAAARLAILEETEADLLAALTAKTDPPTP